MYSKEHTVFAQCARALAGVADRCGAYSARDVHLLAITALVACAVQPLRGASSAERTIMGPAFVLQSAAVYHIQCHFSYAGLTAIRDEPINILLRGASPYDDVVLYTHTRLLSGSNDVHFIARYCDTNQTERRIVVVTAPAECAVALHTVRAMHVPERAAPTGTIHPEQWVGTSIAATRQGLRLSATENSQLIVAYCPVDLAPHIPYKLNVAFCIKGDRHPPAGLYFDIYGQTGWEPPGTDFVPLADLLDGTRHRLSWTFSVSNYPYALYLRAIKASPVEVILERVSIKKVTQIDKFVSDVTSFIAAPHRYVHVMALCLICALLLLRRVWCRSWCVRAWSWMWPCLRRAAWPAWLAPCVVAAVFIFWHGTNIPILDDWQEVPKVAALFDGTMPLSALAAPHGVHRILFPRLVIVAVAWLTDYNIKALLYVSWLCMCLMAILMSMAVWQSSRFQAWRGAALWAAVPVMCLIFHWRQFESLVWASCLGHLMLTGMITLSLFLLARSAGLRTVTWTVAVTAAAVACGGIATFVGFAGWTVWVGGVAILCLVRTPVLRRLGLLLTWLLAAAAASALYFHALNLGDAGTTAGKTGALLPKLVQYCITIMGGALCWTAHPALAWGCLTLCIGAAAVLALAYHRLLAQNAFFIGVILAMSACLVLITLGRADFGFDGYVISRYATYGLVLLAALYGILINLVVCGRSAWLAPLMLTVVLYAISASMVYSYPLGWTMGKGFAAHYRKCQLILRTCDAIPRTISATLHGMEPVLPLVRARRWSLFARNVQVPVCTNRPLRMAEAHEHSIECNLFVNGTQVVMTNTTIRLDDATHLEVHGYAFDDDRREPIRRMLFYLNDSPLPSFYGSHTPELSARAGTPRLSFAGFYAALDTKQLAQGVHTLSWAYVCNDGVGYPENVHVLCVKP